MAYVRKTHDVFEVQSLYNGEWETVYESLNRQDSRLRLKEYRENEPETAHRLHTKREYNEEVK